METKNRIISIFSGLLILIIGIVFGVLYQPRQLQNILETTTPPAVKVLSSKTIPSITAYGLITKIDGNNITIDNQGDSMTMTVRDDAKIYAFLATTGKSQQITLKDLKIGDNLSVNVKITSSGQVDAYSLIVLPPIPKPAVK